MQPLRRAPDIPHRRLALPRGLPANPIANSTIPTMTGSDDIARQPRPGGLSQGLAALLTDAVATTPFPRLERLLLNRAADAAEATLRHTVEEFSSTIASYRAPPQRVAERPIPFQALADPGNEGIIPFVNEQLGLTASSLQVADVCLMGLGGTTIAARSNRKERSFVGENVAYRPCFLQAVKGGLGQFLALGISRKALCDNMQRQGFGRDDFRDQRVIFAKMGQIRPVRGRIVHVCGPNSASRALR